MARGGNGCSILLLLLLLLLLLGIGFEGKSDLIAEMRALTS